MSYNKKVKKHCAQNNDKPEKVAKKKRIISQKPPMRSMSAKNMFAIERQSSVGSASNVISQHNNSSQNKLEGRVRNPFIKASLRMIANSNDQLD